MCSYNSSNDKIHYTCIILVKNKLSVIFYNSVFFEKDKKACIYNYTIITYYYLFPVIIHQLYLLLDLTIKQNNSVNFT